MVSAENSIIALDYNNASVFSVISNLSYAVALDVHYHLGYIFWSDTREQNIKRSNMDGTNITVIHNDTGHCWGLAVEWNSLQLYWTDATNGAISVSDFEGENKRTVISSDLDKPDGIALDPHER